jgi:hypothetical protein
MWISLKRILILFNWNIGWNSCTNVAIWHIFENKKILKLGRIGSHIAYNSRTESRLIKLRRRTRNWHACSRVLRIWIKWEATFGRTPWTRVRAIVRSLPTGYWLLLLALRPIPDLFIVRLHMSSNHSWSIHQSFLVGAETPRNEAGSWREISLNLVDVVSLSYSAEIFNMP